MKRGPKHDYLGMSLDFSSSEEVALSMNDYVDGIIDQDPAEWSETATTPAATHIFDTNKDTPKVDETRAAMFHYSVVKILFL